MATKEEKKNKIRQDIIKAAKIYKQNLAGNHYLYVYGETYFEVAFPVDHFLHLTGVETTLSAKQFYKIARNAELANNQFYFSLSHPYSTAKKKLSCLIRLPELTNEMVCILMDLQTKSITYKISVSNLEFTLGLVEHTNNNGTKIGNLFLPRTLRIKDSAVEKSTDGEIVDFILFKNASMSKYHTLLVKDDRKNIPNCIKHLLNETLVNSFCK